MAPSAVIPAASKCVGKHIKKLGLLLEKFTGRMTQNQQKRLAGRLNAELNFHSNQ